MTTETQILAATTAAATSSDVVLEAGESCTICAYAAADFTADFSATIKYKIGSVYFTAAAAPIGVDSGGPGAGSLNRHRFSRNQTIVTMQGPITLAIDKAAGSEAVGFFKVT